MCVVTVVPVTAVELDSIVVTACVVTVQIIDSSSARDRIDSRDSH